MSNAPNPLKKECKDWAEKTLKTMRNQGLTDIGIPLIEPKDAPCTGAYLTTKGWYSQEWAYHYAVFHGDLVMDEVYPGGKPQQDYERLFEEPSELIFTRQSSCTR